MYLRFKVVSTTQQNIGTGKKRFDMIVYWGGLCHTHDASQIIGSVLGRVPKALINLNLPLLMGAECTRDVGFLQSFLAEIWKSDLLQELFVFLGCKDRE